MGPYFKPLKTRILREKTIDRSLTYQVVITISWTKLSRKKRVQSSRDCFGTLTSLPFLTFGSPLF